MNDTIEREVYYNSNNASVFCTGLTNQAAENERLDFSAPSTSNLINIHQNTRKDNLSRSVTLYENGNSSQPHCSANEASAMFAYPYGQSDPQKMKRGKLISKRTASPYSSSFQSVSTKFHSNHSTSSIYSPSCNRGYGFSFEHSNQPDLTGSPTKGLLHQDWNLQKLSNEIWKFYHENKQSIEVHQLKMRLREKLHSILRIKFPSCGLYVVGSSMTGLGINSSDMDVCLMLTDKNVGRKEAVGILLQLKALFRKYTFLRNVIVIHAKVPIIKFVDRMSHIEVDLNINNPIGIRNTQLLTSYARVDKRFPALVVLAKQWARDHDINDAKHQSLSSYCVALMIIHYLQYKCDPPVLPNLQLLQLDKFNPRTPVRDLKLYEDLPNFTSDNKQDLGELFLGFLDYFAHEFNYKRDAISIRRGGTIPKKDAMYDKTSEQNSVNQWKLLGIEEPFDRTNVARAVFNENTFDYVLHVFHQSHANLKKSLDLKSILRL